jgi:hypothetical protein
MQRWAGLCPRQGARPPTGQHGAGRGPAAARGRGQGRVRAQQPVVEAQVPGGTHGPPGVPVIAQPNIPPVGQAPVPAVLQAAITAALAAVGLGQPIVVPAVPPIVPPIVVSPVGVGQFVPPVIPPVGLVQPVIPPVGLVHPVIPPVGLVQPVNPPVVIPPIPVDPQGAFVYVLEHVIGLDTQAKRDCVTHVAGCIIAEDLMRVETDSLINCLDPTTSIISKTRLKTMKKWVEDTHDIHGVVDIALFNAGICRYNQCAIAQMTKLGTGQTEKAATKEKLTVWNGR